MDKTQNLTKLESASKNESLEGLLQQLCHFGRPSITRLDNGWWCRCAMHVATAGTTFQIDSETKHKTPTDAARECAERVVATLKQWNQ